MIRRRGMVGRLFGRLFPAYAGAAASLYAAGERCRGVFGLKGYNSKASIYPLD